MFKADFHLHTSDDPVDDIPHTHKQLVDRAAELGFRVLAITLHERQYRSDELTAYARERGIVLVEGVEATIARRHILLLNFPASADSISTFDALADLKLRHPNGIVIAPHAFYPHPSALRGDMDRHADLMDAVELNAYYTASIDFNRAAIRWARDHSKPVIANSDTHRLSLLGTTFTYVDSEPEPDAICAALKAGRVTIETRPLSTVYAASYLARLQARAAFRAVWPAHREPRPDRVPAA